jgi:hypothetical protein
MTEREKVVFSCSADRVQSMQSTHFRVSSTDRRTGASYWLFRCFGGLWRHFRRKFPQAKDLGEVAEAPAPWD